MRIQTAPNSRGSVLVIALLATTIIGFTLLGYLKLISNESRSVARSQAWNAAVPVMEAGVEEALTQIHYNGYTNLGANDWTYEGDGCYHKVRTVGTDGSYCEVAIRPVDPPVIFSTAYEPAPLNASNYIVRKVRVTTRKRGHDGGGLTARNTISFGGGASLDSFNSCDGPYDPANRGTNGVAVSNSKTPGAITVSGGDIYGLAITGPGGTVNTGGNGAVGDLNWCATQSGVQPGHSFNDANIQFDDVKQPYTYGWIPTSGPGGNGTNYTYVLDGNFLGRYYWLGNLTISGGQSMIVKGHAKLYVTGKFTTTGTGFVYLAPGSSLDLYLGGTFSVQGSGIVNGTGQACNLSIYGLPTCTSISYAGGSALIATVYAPEANLSFSGGAGAYGDFTADTISATGNGGVHYDECLGNLRGYVVDSWNEL